MVSVRSFSFPPQRFSVPVPTPETASLASKHAEGSPLLLRGKRRGRWTAISFQPMRSQSVSAPGSASFAANRGRPINAPDFTIDSSRLAQTALWERCQRRGGAKLDAASPPSRDASHPHPHILHHREPSRTARLESAAGSSRHMNANVHVHQCDLG